VHILQLKWPQPTQPPSRPAQPRPLLLPPLHVEPVPTTSPPKTSASAASTPPSTHLRGLDAAKIKVSSKLGFQHIHRPRFIQRPLAELWGGWWGEGGAGALPQRGLRKAGHLRVGARQGLCRGKVWAGASGFEWQGSG